MRLQPSEPDYGAFLGFPQDVQQRIQRCQSHLCHMKNVTSPENPDALFNHSEWISLDSFCPGARSQSTVAHASMAVATVTMLTHLIMVLSINSGLVKLYGPCLLLCLLFSSLHSAVLFSAAYISDTDYLNLTSLNSDEVVQKYPTFMTKCWLADIMSHYLVLVIHTTVLVGLLERYYRMKRLFLNPFKLSTPRLVAKSKFLRTLSPHRRPRKPDSHSELSDKFDSRSENYTCGNNVKLKHLPSSLCAKPDLKRTLNPSRKTRFAQFKDNNNNNNSAVSYHERSGFGLHPCPSRHSSRLWLIGQPLVIIILPICPVSFGIWASEYLQLDSWWNPAYGYLTCGNIGGCIAANQWLIYIPLGFINLINITLIIVISLRTDTNCLIQEQCTSHNLESKAQFCMLAKISLSHLFIWTVACVSNYVCIGTLWQFYAICTGLQSLFIFVSFVFSRPFLEMVFKRDDPLGRLKLDSLAMQLPLGVLHNREPNASMNYNSNNPRYGGGGGGDRFSRFTPLVNSVDLRQLK